MKLKNSLLSKYLLIIFLAIVIMPISSILISIIFYSPLVGIEDDRPEVYRDRTEIEKNWHEEAKKLGNASNEEINDRLSKLKERYSEASLFWVDETGQTQKKLPDTIEIPQSWTSSYSIDFLKKNRGYDADPFTVVALIGEQTNKGFMVIQVPRSLVISPIEKIRDLYDFLMMAGVLIILVLFVFISWVFFYKIRKRLLCLQTAMSKPAANGIPVPLDVKNKMRSVSWKKRLIGWFISWKRAESGKKRKRI